MDFYHLEENIKNNYWIQDQMLPKKVLHKAGKFLGIKSKGSTIKDLNYAN